MGVLQFHDLEYLARASDHLTSAQRNRFLELAKRDTQGALKYFYSLEGQDPYKHISTEAKVKGIEKLKLGDILEAKDEIDYNNEQVQRSLQIVRDYIKDDERLTRVLEHLTSRSSLETIAEFVDDLSLDDIRNKLEMLADRLIDEEGILAVPKRIVSVDFGNVVEVKKRRNYTQESPLEIFKRTYNNTITREEFNRLDPSLYKALIKHKQIDKAIPRKSRLRRDHISIYRERYGSLHLTRGQLQSRDPALYKSLRLNNQLHFIPKSLNRNDYTSLDPIRVFNSKYGESNPSRNELRTLDPALYKALFRYNQIDEAMPKKKNS